MAHCEPNGPWCPDCQAEAQAAGTSEPACSALTKACERTIKYLREIGESTRGESTFPSAEYADAMADDLEHALTPNAPHERAPASGATLRADVGGTVAPGMTCDGCENCAPNGACMTFPQAGRPCNEFKPANAGGEA